MIYCIFFLISFGASVVGAVCGIGGGVIIKPVLDAFGMLDVKTINFLSGTTVLAMSICAFVTTRLKKESLVDMRIGTLLAVGAAAGGVMGKSLFQVLTGAYDQRYVGGVQALCLLAVTLATLIYTIVKEKLPSFQVTNALVCLLVGLVLGVLSSFLGIGGGPINLGVLFLFFSMPVKTAAQNSLYIILFSQITSLVQTVATGSVPKVSVFLLLLMVIGGIGGGVFGRKVSRKIDAEKTNKLFILLMVVIIFINIYNTYKYLA